MKTIFDPTVRTEIIQRIEALSPGKRAQWGKMNLFQMLRHNTYWNSWVLGDGNFTYKQAFLGKVFGKIALRKMTGDEKGFARNIPTSAQFKGRENEGDLEAEKQKWISLLKNYEHYANPEFIHDFFGKMSPEEIGVLVYKHSDHHLRQFGV